ncbi:hypothetical protein CCMSSC00406_0009486 [Pleurotus cornucopiae]|uniref:Uncharacterized protein n=1 Tax=Pleurotus cornucopiae TaxID=5321 RepID=A0ACB7ITB6_PLECO|nr:hypothetical protein CCMSSC00406_0009486 [Pleurotus cornucopiae]
MLALSLVPVDWDKNAADAAEIVVHIKSNALEPVHLHPPAMEVQNASASRHSTFTSAPPTTSPPVAHHKSPYSCIPLPSQVDHHHRPIIIHPALHHRHTDRLELDLLNRSELPARLMRRGCALEPATNPPLPSLSLLIPSFPWPITVHASSTWRGRPAVTALDIFAALDRALRLPASEDVVPGGLMGSGRRQNWQASQLDARNEPRVFERLEYLRGRRKFVGLSNSTMDSDTMVVHIE